MITSAFYEFEVKKTRFQLMPFTKEFLNDPSVSSRYLEWFNDPEVTKNNSHGLFPYTEKKKEAFLDSLNEGTEKIVFAIVAVEQSYDGEAVKKIHVGNASLQSINWINRSAEYAITIGETAYHGMGLGTVVLGKLIEHAFCKLNMHRVWTGTAATNIGMQRNAEKNSMMFEAAFKEAQFLNGKYVDIYEYAILKQEWKGNE